MATPLVRDYMTPNPITVDVDTTVAKAQRLMRENGVRHLPILSNDILVGIVTLTDILEAAAPEPNRLVASEPGYILGAVPVEEVMTPDPAFISPDDTVLEAADLMFQHDIGSLPVVENDRVTGIITETDIFHLVVRMLAEQAED
jgi:acetoin utilization protein AcuB